MCSWILCWQFLWHLHCCHCCDSHRIQWLKNRRQATSQSPKNHLQDAWKSTSHSTIQHGYQNHHKLRAAKWLFPISCDLAKSWAAPWQSETDSCKWPNSRSLRASCPTIRHWKNVLGNRFFHDTSHKGRVHHHQLVANLTNNCFGLEIKFGDCQARHICILFFPLWLPFPLGSGSWHPKAAEQKLCPSPRRDTEWMLSPKTIPSECTEK